jgi:trans-2,3-dihydro-3-hydroxyanthranilate isomerase
MIWMSHRTAEFGPPWPDRPAVAAALGLTVDDLHPDAPVQIVSTGAPFLFVAFRDPLAVDRAVLDYRAYAAMRPGESTIGVFLTALDPRFRPSTVHSRMLSGGATGIGEDPATGGASGPLGAYLLRHGLVQTRDKVEIVSRQGVQMGRPSTVHITLRPADDVIEVGGTVVPVLTGTLTLPAENDS